MDATTRRCLRDEGKCFYYKKQWEPGHRCLRKGQVHYIKVHSDGGTDDSNLEVGTNLPKRGQPQIEGTLGSTIASMHGVKKYLTLKVVE